MRVRLCLRLAAGWRQLPDAASSHQLVLPAKKSLFLRRVRPLAAATLENLRTRQRRASPEQCLRSVGKRANFGAGKICPFAQ